jgi:GAF domain-containing protein
VERDIAGQLARIATDLGPALSPIGFRESLQAIVDTAAIVFEAGACSIAVLDSEGEELEFVATSRGPEDPILGRRIAVGIGIAGWAVASGQVIAVDEVAGDQRFARDLAEQTGYVPGTILAVPAEGDDEPLGVLSVLDRVPHAREMELASGFARQAALAISSLRAFEDLGRVLLRAAGDAAADEDVAGALRRASGVLPVGSGDLVELAAAFAELRRLGARERAAATRLVTHFLAYAGSRRD